MSFKKRFLILLALATLCMACSKSEQARADTDLLVEVTAAIVEAALSDGSDGVRRAQGIMDQRAEELSAAMARLSSLRGFQVDDETKSLIEAAITDCAADVNGLHFKLIRQAMEDETLKGSLDALIKNYNGLLLDS